MAFRAVASPIFALYLATILRRPATDAILIFVDYFLHFLPTRIKFRAITTPPISCQHFGVAASAFDIAAPATWHRCQKQMMLRAMMIIYFAFFMRSCFISISPRRMMRYLRAFWPDMLAENDALRDTARIFADGRFAADDRDEDILACRRLTANDDISLHSNSAFRH